MVIGMNSNKRSKSAKIVKVLGQMVREDTKKHAILVAQVKHFNDLSKHE